MPIKVRNSPKIDRVNDDVMNAVYDVMNAERATYMLALGVTEALLRRDSGCGAVASLYARLVEVDLGYNGYIYRGLVDMWLEENPYLGEVDKANQVLRLFYSLTHHYAYPGEDEPNGWMPLYPVELLYYRLGDCEDHAMLAAALFKSAGFRVRIITFPNHVALQVKISGEWRFIEATVHRSNGEDISCGEWSEITVDWAEKYIFDEYEGETYYYAEVGS